MCVQDGNKDRPLCGVTATARCHCVQFTELKKTGGLKKAPGPTVKSMQRSFPSFYLFFGIEKGTYGGNMSLIPRTGTMA
jgi:hypothetical protein